MADFRKRLLTLSGVALAFAGVAFGQATCANPISAGNFIRTEGTTELLADLYVTCTNSTGAGIAAGAVTNVTMYLNLPVTSKTLSAANASPSYTEALIGTVAAGALANPVQGIVNGTQVTFLNVPTPAVAAAASYQLAITNVRVNASSISSTTPTPVAATLFINTATGAGPLVGATVLSNVVVAFAQNGLSAATIPTTGTMTFTNPPFLPANFAAIPNLALATTNFTICAGSNAIGFNVQFGEAFPNAFKIQTAANATLGAAATNNTETGYQPAAFPNAGAVGSNVANSGTRIAITYNNIPAGVAVYVPLTIQTDPNFGVGTIALINSATATTGAGNLSTATTDTLASGSVAPAYTTTGYGKLTVSGTTAVAWYEVTTQNPGATDKFTVSTYLKVSGNTVPAASAGSAITATVSFAPIAPPAGTIPAFVVGALSTPQNGSVYGLCTTTLLFPYVVNTLGFDTGIAIGNTSNDLLGLKNGAAVTSAANQAGTCSLTFWGTGAPAAPVVTASVATGASYLAVLSGIAPGFQGYMIANCNFLYGHGFAYITYNLGSASGVSMGYLADTINPARGGVGIAGEATNN